MARRYGEYGLFRKKYVTRQEYDDGVTVVNGKPVDLIGKVKLRTRKLSKYNFLIAPSTSPINNNCADQPIADIMNDMLKGTATIDGLKNLIFRLPKNGQDF